jgi:hypothetical protein
MQLKALSTLSMLFAQKPGQEVVQIVPQWAFEYKRLLLDYNREVRRATHDTMSSLVKTVKYVNYFISFHSTQTQLVGPLLLPVFLDQLLTSHGSMKLLVNFCPAYNFYQS